jgi:hypothetical protein
MQDQVTYKVGKHYDDCHNFRREDGRLFGFTDGCLPMNRWDELNISSAEPSKRSYRQHALQPANSFISWLQETEVDMACMSARR